MRMDASAASTSRWPPDTTAPPPSGPKARAGFVVHATRSSQARVLRALGTSYDKTSIRGLAQRDPSAFEL